MSTELKIQYMPLSAILRWDRNPKLHSDEALSASVSRFGFTAPVIVNERTGVLVAGHGRLDELVRRKAAGEDPPARVVAKGDDWLVPVVRGVSFETDEEAAAYAIADNRIVEMGGWDDNELSKLLAEIQTTDLGLGGTGFTADDLMGLQVWTDQGMELPDALPPSPVEGQIKALFPTIILRFGSEDDATEFRRRFDLKDNAKSADASLDVLPKLREVFGAEAVETVPEA